MTDQDPLADIFRHLCTIEAPLNQRLAAFSAAVKTHAPVFAEAYDDLVERLKRAAAGSDVPRAGDEMPSFFLPDCHGRAYLLDDLLAKGPVVISLNRGHWCEYCAIELEALGQALGEIEAAGARVVSIMPETAEFIAKASRRGGRELMVLSDQDSGYALSLNLVVWLGDRIRELLSREGVRLERYQGNGSWFVPIPATFVVGADKRIVRRYVDPDFRRRMEIDDILAAVRQVRR